MLKDLDAKKMNVSATAVAALNEGAGTRAIGAPIGVTVGNEYKLLGIDYVTRKMPVQGVSMEEWNKLEGEEKEQNSVERSWFIFITNNGDLSFTSVFGDSEMFSQDFWKEEGEVSKADDFDITADNILHVSNRTPASFIESGCDGLIGKTLKAVARRDWQVTTRTERVIDRKAIAWVVK